MKRSKWLYFTVGTIVVISVIASLFLPVERALTVHTSIINLIGTRVTSSGNMDSPDINDPLRVHVNGADNKFFSGRIVITATDDSDGDTEPPRPVVEIYNGESYVAVINSTATDDEAETFDLPLTGFDPAGKSNGEETFRIFLSDSDDTSAKIRYLFVANVQN